MKTATKTLRNPALLSSRDFVTYLKKLAARNAVAKAVREAREAAKKEVR